MENSSPNSESGLNNMTSGDESVAVNDNEGKNLIQESEKHRFDDNEGDLENNDSFPKQEDMKFTFSSIFFILFSIVNYTFDMGSDIAVAHFYYKNNHYWYFILTLAFVLIPSLIISGISLRWYVNDYESEDSPSKLKWFMRLILILLQLGPISRYFDALIYGFKFKYYKKRKYIKYKLFQDTDAAMLRIFEGCMESAPQVVLQIYIVAKSSSDQDNYSIIQLVSVVTSLVSVSWCLVSYNKALRASQPKKLNMTASGMVVQFFWRLFSIASRVLVLGLFASEFRFYVAIICFVHWIFMFFWIVSMRTSFCESKCEELGYNVILAVMFIFCYLNPVDSPTRKRYAFHYTVIFIEDMILLSLWYIWCDPCKWYREIALFLYFSCFFTALVLMPIYYLKFHPTGNISVFQIGRDKDLEGLIQTNCLYSYYKCRIQNGLWTVTATILPDLSWKVQNLANSI